jgi:hypothetical protein
MERIKSQMWSIWAPKCADMFRRAPPVPINGDAPAYYRSVATLQVGAPAAGRPSAQHCKRAPPSRASSIPTGQRHWLPVQANA